MSGRGRPRRRSHRVGAAIALLLLGACAQRTAAIRLLPIPTTVALRATTTTIVAPELVATPLLADQLQIPSTTLVFTGGRVTISGSVTGPDGPVANASVHLERLVGDQVAGLDVRTDGAGNFRVEAQRAGRIRARAWRTPDLAQPSDVVAFVTEGVTLELHVERFAGTYVQWSLAPGQPVLGRKANLVVQVAGRKVGTDGIVRTEALPDIGVSLTALGALQPVGAADGITDEQGRAAFVVSCNTTGAADLSVTLATGEQSAISPKPCAPPPTIAPPTAAPAPVGTEAPVIVAPVPVPSTVVPDVPITVAPVPAVGAPEPVPPPATAPVAPPVVVAPAQARRAG